MYLLSATRTYLCTCTRTSTVCTCRCTQNVQVYTVPVIVLYHLSTVYRLQYTFLHCGLWTLVQYVPVQYLLYLYYSTVRPFEIANEYSMAFAVSHCRLNALNNLAACCTRVRVHCTSTTVPTVYKELGTTALYWFYQYFLQGPILHVSCNDRLTGRSTSTVQVQYKYLLYLSCTDLYEYLELPYLYSTSTVETVLYEYCTTSILNTVVYSYGVQCTVLEYG